MLLPHFSSKYNDILRYIINGIVRFIYIFIYVIYVNG